MVGHSLASAVVPLVAVKRSVRLLCYLCPAMGGFPRSPDAPPFMREEFDPPRMNSDDCSWWPHERAVTQMYGRIDRQLAERLATRLRPQSRTVFTHPYPPERPPEVPSAFIYTQEDELFDDTWSRWISRELLGVEAIELPGGAGGHFPMLEHPALLADTLERLALQPDPGRKK